jgi:hypothetical protein
MAAGNIGAARKIAIVTGGLDNITQLRNRPACGSPEYQVR